MRMNILYRLVKCCCYTVEQPAVHTGKCISLFWCQITLAFPVIKRVTNRINFQRTESLCFTLYYTPVTIKLKSVASNLWGYRSKCENCRNWWEKRNLCLRYSLLWMNVLSEISHCSVNVCHKSRHLWKVIWQPISWHFNLHICSFIKIYFVMQYSNKIIITMF